VVAPSLRCNTETRECKLKLRLREELVANAQRGNRDPYAELVRRYRDLAVGTAFVIRGNRQEAEDAVQEALARAFLAMPRFRPHGPFRSWLLRIVANNARTVRTTTQRQADVHRRRATCRRCAHLPPRRWRR
jgi:DNA-directed RNA polymerase specialized sigma24 family protein